MATRGDIIENPILGERIVFLQTDEDTNGQLLEVDLFVEPGKPLTPEHFHAHQEVRFEMISGKMVFGSRKKEQTLGPGQSVLFPRATPMRWAVVGDQTAHLRVNFSPSVGYEHYFETLYGLARDGKTNEKGLPNLFQLAVLAHEYGTYLPFPPVGFQKVLIAVIALVGRALGYQARYPEYCGKK